MKNFFKQHWFLTTLAFLILSGLSLGLAGAGPTVSRVTDLLNPRWVTAGVLFLMSYSLDSGKLWRAFQAPGPVILGFLLNYGLVPVLAWLLLPLQQNADFRYGLMIAATVPCTTAAASVMTRKAHGNDAVSLLTTLSTNLSCFILTPMWLRWTTGASVPFDTFQMMTELMQAVLIPTVLGQLLRIPAKSRQFAVRYKVQIGIAAQVLIELMVFTAALRAGTKLYEMRAPPAQVETGVSISADETGADSGAATQREPVTATALVIVLLSCAGVHVGVLATGWFLARRLGIPAPEAAAVAFAGSQKTLPIGLYVATNPATFGVAYPFAMFPMLLFHTSQLFLDTAVASRLAGRHELDPPASSG